MNSAEAERVVHIIEFLDLRSGRNIDGAVGSWSWVRHVMLLSYLSRCKQTQGPYWMPAAQPKTLEW